jgi:hypothetical protein
MPLAYARRADLTVVPKHSRASSTSAGLVFSTS